MQPFLTLSYYSSFMFSAGAKWNTLQSVAVAVVVIFATLEFKCSVDVNKSSNQYQLFYTFFFFLVGIRNSIYIYV